jgi:hypothetical protein
LDAYQLGLGTKDAQLKVQQFSSTKYKSHQQVSETGSPSTIHNPPRLLLARILIESILFTGILSSYNKHYVYQTTQFSHALNS